MSLFVGKDSNGTDRIVRTGTDGRLQVDVLSTVGGQTDDAEFTPASGSVNIIAGFCDDTAPDSVDEGDAGAVRMSSNRSLHIEMRDAAGNERGANVTASNELQVIDSNTGALATNMVAHDAEDAGNPVKVGARARTSQIAAVANNDRADLVTNDRGELVLAGYDWSNADIDVSETNPISDHYLSNQTLANVTNGTDGTYTGYEIDMDGYRSVGIYVWGQGGGAGDSIVFTCEGTVDDTNWVDVTNDLFGVANLTCSDAVAGEDMWAKDNLPGCFKTLRVKVVSTTGDDSGDWKINYKKLY